jgi:hypothetical protein
LGQRLTNGHLGKEIIAMAICGIMRVEKRNRASVYGLQIEANRNEHDREIRDFDRSDIDWELTKNNIHLVETKCWNKEITKQIKQANVKERKDSIVLLDSLYTASPEWFENHSQEEAIKFFKDCLEFHIQEYCGGNKDLVINAVIHLDEKTPHLQVANIPLVEDEKGIHLSAKIVMGGRADYRLRQDRFFEQVSSHYGMDRGEINEPSETKKHTTKREWQIAKQKEELNDLEVKKTLLDFDIQSAESTKRYESKKAKEAKQQRLDEESKLKEIENNIDDKNDELYYLKNDIESAKKDKPWYLSALEEEQTKNDQYERFIHSSEEIENQYYDFLAQEGQDIITSQIQGSQSQQNHYDEEEYEL